MDPDRKTWELTPYEQHRTPHTLETGGEAVLSTPRFLEAELSCAICLDILRDTRTTKECLHRFCGECISQALRSGNKVSSSFYSGETFNHFNTVIWYTGKSMEVPMWMFIRVSFDYCIFVTVFFRNVPIVAQSWPRCALFVLILSLTTSFV